MKITHFYFFFIFFFFNLFCPCVFCFLFFYDFLKTVLIIITIHLHLTMSNRIARLALIPLNPIPFRFYRESSCCCWVRWRAITYTSNIFITCQNPVSLLFSGQFLVSILKRRERAIAYMESTVIIVTVIFIDWFLF